MKSHAFENIGDLMKRGSQHTYSQKLIAFGVLQIQTCILSPENF